QRERGGAFYVGAALYLAFLAFGIATMIPAADYGPWGQDVGFEPRRLANTLVFPLGALVPVNPEWIGTAREFFNGSSVALPRFWNPNPAHYMIAFAQAHTDQPLWFLPIFAAPLIVCWLISRDRIRVAEFATVYGGVLAFATLWGFAGSSRHHGIVFLALLAGAWLARVKFAGDRWSARTLRSLLLVSAVGGVLTLASEF